MFIRLGKYRGYLRNENVLGEQYLYLWVRGAGVLDYGTLVMSP